MNKSVRLGSSSPHFCSVKLDVALGLEHGANATTGCRTNQSSACCSLFRSLVPDGIVLEVQMYSQTVIEPCQSKQCSLSQTKASWDVHCLPCIASPVEHRTLSKLDSFLTGAMIPPRMLTSSMAVISLVGDSSLIRYACVTCVPVRLISTSLPSSPVPRPWMLSYQLKHVQRAATRRR